MSTGTSAVPLQAGEGFAAGSRIIRFLRCFSMAGIVPPLSQLFSRRVASFCSRYYKTPRFEIIIFLRLIPLLCGIDLVGFSCINGKTYSFFAIFSPTNGYRDSFYGKR